MFARGSLRSAQARIFMQTSSRSRGAQRGVRCTEVCARTTIARRSGTHVSRSREAPDGARGHAAHGQSPQVTFTRTAVARRSGTRLHVAAERGAQCAAIAQARPLAQGNFARGKVSRAKPRLVHAPRAPLLPLSRLRARAPLPPQHRARPAPRPLPLKGPAPAAPLPPAGASAALPPLLRPLVRSAGRGRRAAGLAGAGGRRPAGSPAPPAGSGAGAASLRAGGRGSCVSRLDAAAGSRARRDSLRAARVRAARRSPRTPGTSRQAPNGGAERSCQPRSGECCGRGGFCAARPEPRSLTRAPTPAR